MLAAVKAPVIDWAGLSPLIALLGGAVLVLVLGLAGFRVVRTQWVPTLTLAAFGAAIGLLLWQWDSDLSLIEGALRLDRLTILVTLIVCATAILATLLAWRDQAAREIAHGEFFCLLLTASAGMMVLVAAQDLLAAFVGLELLSMPLYVLCASRLRAARSLESGLKYLIVGSVGSATLLYGFALLYGASGTTSYAGIAKAIETGGLAGDPLVLTGAALAVVGLAFKASLAPFHQWTPDVYEGAPTPVTAFMSVATKIAAFGVIVRLFDVALAPAVDDWKPIWIAIAVISIVVGNVGALGQSSLKRLLAYSSIAQAGYILVGVVVFTDLGVQAVLLYIVVYLFANIAAFAVVTLRERETDLGDDIGALRGLGAKRPLMALSMTLAMLSLAGLPATAGFVGKLRLIEAAADGGLTWLGVMIVIGSMISLAYYLPVAAAMWREEAAATPEPGIDPRTGRPALAGGAPGAAGAAAADGRGGWEVTLVAFVCGAASLVFGIVPQPLFDLVEQAARGLGLS
ncbi:MAG: NADH-quinone oxidoreductase subunit N [Solirubrobacteraceae bacterium]|nr:NADH-quinone oxidoreductase subunit N [Solirubrobacteraceae bacterium]